MNMATQPPVATHGNAGESLVDWRPPPAPPRAKLAGRLCSLEPLDANVHAAELHEAYALDAGGGLWEFMAYGPFATAAEYRSWVEARQAASDPLFFAIVDARDGKPAGVASYLRIDPPNGVIEIGHLAFSPRLQRTPAATEALYLMLAHAFGLGYRRCEWKCNARNAASRRAAERLGFTFEGIFRQHMVVKGRNRDTAWYAIVDSDWPRLRAAFEQWLAPANFGPDGRQRRRLSECREPRP